MVQGDLLLVTEYTILILFLYPDCYLSTVISLVIYKQQLEI